jgi:hypothetical protein
MSKNYKQTSLDHTGAITNSHNEDAKALDVVTVNSLVPTRYGKVELEYITTGAAAGQVGKAMYFSNGTYQEIKVLCKGNELGSAHKSTINFVNRSANSLAGQYFIIYDDVGAVMVWFNLNFNNSKPNNSECYRGIEVNVLSSHDHETVAKRVSNTLSMDTKFVAVYSGSYTIISSSSAGKRNNSKDGNTNLFIKNTEGVNPISLSGKYFVVNSAENEGSYYVWYRVNGIGTDPSISGKIGLMVSISGNATSSEVASNTKIVLDSTSKFITNIDNDALFISNEKIGEATIAFENSAGFTVLAQKMGENRNLLVTLVLSYSSDGSINSVERI